MLISTTAIIVIVIWLIGFGVAMLVNRSPSTLCGGMVSGWLFLPQITLDFPGLTLHKIGLVTIVSCVAAAFIDARYRIRFRPCLIDILVLFYLTVIVASSISNQLGIYDGIANAIASVQVWGLPWFIGRTQFASSANAEILARFVVLGCLIYTPFCMYEMKMSPMLHFEVFGYMPRGPESLRGLSFRYGLWRPTVFMETGLQLALLMGMGSVLAYWATLTGTFQCARLVSNGLFASLLSVVTLLCVSTGAILLTALGGGLMYLSRLQLRRVTLFAISLLPFVYPMYRMANIGKTAVIDVSEHNSALAQRQASLNTRIMMEEKFLSKWQEQPLLGWTGRYYFPDDHTLSDSLWIQLLGKTGLFGWSCLTLMMMTPCIRAFLTRQGSDSHRRIDFALAICVLVFMLDCMFNSMMNPICVVMAGAIATRWDTTCESDVRTGSQTLRVTERRVSRVLWPAPVKQNSTRYEVRGIGIDS